MKKSIVRVALVAGVAIAALSPAIANHSWGGYHWQRSGAEVTAPVGDNVSAAWDSYLQVAVNGGGAGKPGWNSSNAIQSPLVPGATNPKNCKAVPGRIEVCNSRYGNNGWLGIASIWLSSGHIVQGTTKLNDTYFSTPSYNTPAWRRLVTCQEVGHDYGLGHTNEIFTNYNDGTCMDYTNAPAGGVVGGFNYGPSNEYINQHDLDLLASIYNHADATNFGIRTVGQSAAPPSSDSGLSGDSPAEWGRAIGHDGHGRPDTFELDLGNGRKKITHVFWAVGEGPKGQHHDDH